jgi:hypothetical protein
MGLLAEIYDNEKNIISSFSFSSGETVQFQ